MRISVQIEGLDSLDVRIRWLGARCPYLDCKSEYGKCSDPTDRRWDDAGVRCPMCPDGLCPD